MARLGIWSLRNAAVIAIALLALGDDTSAASLTSLVNLFIGTASGANGGSGGNAFPGSAIPHAMVKVGIFRNVRLD